MVLDKLILVGAQANEVLQLCHTYRWSSLHVGLDIGWVRQDAFAGHHVAEVNA